MALDTDVFPAAEAACSNLQVNGLPAFKHVAIGEQLSIPADPCMWIMLSSWNAPDRAGPDLEQTDWMLEFRLMAKYAADARNAELTLASLLEPLRATLRAHIKMGTTSIVYGRIQGGGSGYIRVNQVPYRFYSLHMAVREKTSVAFAA